MYFGGGQYWIHIAVRNTEPRISHIYLTEPCAQHV